MIKDGAITQSKLSSGVQGQLNTIYTAAILNTPGQEPSLTRGKGATAVTRSTASVPVRSTWPSERTT